MKILKFIKYDILKYSLLIFSLSSCEKFVEVDIRSGELLQETVFKDSLNAEAAIIGLYLNIVSNNIEGMLTGGMTLITGLNGDELQPQNTSAVYTEVYENNMSVENSVALNAWAQSFKLIYNANACIEGITKMNNISDSKRRQLLGEALLIRSALYFYLTQIYGDLPLILTTNYEENKTAKRVSQTQIFNQIIDDLNNAKKYLKSLNYITYRANYYAVLGFLSRVHLFLGNYEESRILTEQIISSNLFQLETNLNNVFLKSSKEVIWSLYNNENTNTTGTKEGMTFIPNTSTVLPAYILTSNVISHFHDYDLRKSSWINSNKVNGINYFFPFKYKYGRSVSGGTMLEQYAIIRLAEIYLISAESNARVNNIYKAVIDLNLIRVRAGLDPITNNISQKELLDHIYLERKRELFCEWGTRWLDLVRLEQLSDEMKKNKSTWKDYNRYLPIPRVEIESNPFLLQNVGY